MSLSVTVLFYLKAMSVESGKAVIGNLGIGETSNLGFSRICYSFYILQKQTCEQEPLNCQRYVRE